MRDASKVGNHPSKFGHAGPLDTGIIRYARDGRTDRWTDGRTKATLIAPFPMVEGKIEPSKIHTSPRSVTTDLV